MQRLVEECSKKDTPWRSTLESLLDPARVDYRPGEQDEPEDYGELLLGRSDEEAAVLKLLISMNGLVPHLGTMYAVSASQTGSSSQWSDSRTQAVVGGVVKARRSSNIPQPGIKAARHKQTFGLARAQLRYVKRHLQPLPTAPPAPEDERVSEKDSEKWTDGDEDGQARDDPQGHLQQQKMIKALAKGELQRYVKFIVTDITDLPGTASVISSLLDCV